jgi:hypothetical protein
LNGLKPLNNSEPYLAIKEKKVSYFTLSDQVLILRHHLPFHSHSLIHVQYKKLISKISDSILKLIFSMTGGIASGRVQLSMHKALGSVPGKYIYMCIYIKHTKNNK